ncbi:unnamed protein product [Bodo saltans]|uniref:Uncharacterized protein n=1 Tax=Bodo saltans TaxID=75058 RepID=A0A0S4JBI5_BODSA|nr:unnamed protein product [Bodo saltans]|eukprot:CUG84899.1 unnamed protein product [Bodo saltans]
MQVDLKDSGSALPSTLTDVAMFKEQISKTRVVADSQKFLVYSLKNPASLRVLARANNAQGMFKNHKNDVTAAKFVNHKSNVIATASEGEFFVWFITVNESREVETKVYFSLIDTVTVRSFCWFIDSVSATPELLILYGNTAAHLQSSKLISSFGATTPAVPEVALKDYALLFDRQVGPDAAFTAVGAGGLFAFATDAVSVAVSTARHGNAPSFRACDGEALIGLEVLQDKPAVLLAACSSFAALWSIDGEPTKLYKINIGSPIVVALSTLNTVALFSNNKEVFLIDVAAKKLQQHTRHALSFQVPAAPQSVTFNASESSGFVSMCDFGTRLSIHTWKRPFSENAAPAAPTAAPAAAAKTPFVDPAVVSASAMPTTVVANGRRQLAPPQQQFVPVAPPAYIPQQQQQPVQQQPPRVSLSNANLPQVPQDGQIAQVFEQCQAEIAALKAQLDSAVQNTNQILTLVPQMVKRDHSSLVTLSLEAQITELQNAARAGEIGGSSSGAAAGPVGFESQLLATVMDDVANRLVEGLVPGIRDALLSDLEPSLRTAVMSHIKKSQKDVFKNRVDALLKNVTSEFISELEKKQRVDEKQFENYGKEVRRMAEGSMTKLLQQINSLEDQVLAIQNSGILDEVKSLRVEVQALRAAAASGVAQDVAIAPATIIATARAMIDANEPERGLEYVCRMNVPSATIELLEDIGRDETTRDNALQVQNNRLWESILLQLTATTRSTQLHVALQWIKDIVTDHEKSLQVAAVSNAVKSFIQTWKQEKDIDAAVQKELRIVEKLVR